MVYEPYDWELARINAAKLLLLAQYDLDEFGYFNEVILDNGAETYTGDGGIEYIGIDPLATEHDGSYIFNDSLTAAKFDGSLLIGYLTPHCRLLKRCRDVDLRDKVDGVIRIYTDFDNDCLLYPEVDYLTYNDITIVDMSIPIDRYEEDNRNGYIRHFDLIVWQHDNYGLLIDGSLNPVTSVEIQLNGQYRQSKRSGFWHDTIEPYIHHTKTPPKDGLNLYSFALFPEDHQPSGTCNFSRIDTANLNLWFAEFACNKYADVFIDSDNKVLIFAVNYNVLRIMSGMGGLAYSN